MSVIRDIPGGSLFALADISDEVKRQLTPIGKVIEWWRPSAAVPIPDGWVVCDGSPVAAGAHDFPGVGGFNTPDMRNRFVLGANTANADGAAGNDTAAAADAPGIGGTGGAQIVNDRHQHGVAHTHWINADFSHHGGHNVNAHAHSLSGHTHSITMPNTPQFGNAVNARLMYDPSDSRMDISGNSHFKSNQLGNRHSIRCLPFTTLGELDTWYIRDDPGATQQDVYEQDMTGPNTANTPSDGASSTSSTSTASHNHGGGTGSTTPLTDFQGSTTRENRPAYVGLLRLMKVRQA